MESVWSTAASAEALQAVKRPFLCGKSQRHRGPLPKPSGQGDGVMRRPEEPDPGLRTHPAVAAFGPGLCGRRYAQLHPARHDDLIRSARDRIGPSPHPMQTPASTPGIPAVPHIHRPKGPERSRHSPGRRQLRHAQARKGQTLDRSATALPRSLYPDLHLLAQPGADLVRHHHPESHPRWDLQEGKRPDREH